jgi:hypothetical protein
MTITFGVEPIVASLRCMIEASVVACRLSGLLNLIE